MIRLLGVMTGTSCDGLDAACMEFDRESWRPLWSMSAPYPSSLRKQVLAFQKPKMRHSVESFLALDRDLGEWYSAAISKIIDAKAEKPDAIANHGQTVAHFPKKKALGTTLQFGDPARLATRTGLTVISHFRNGDMAAGGEGAPLVPRFHQALALKLNTGSEGIAIHNIGGISNMTYLGPRGKIIAFDTGPGNIWIDEAASVSSAGKLKMDRDGRLSVQGTVDSKAVAAALRNPYFRKTPPKSTGRDDFPFEAFRKTTRAKGPSLVATALAVTVKSIVSAYENWILGQGLPLSRVYICGGGAKNPNLLAGLRSGLSSVSWEPMSSAGWDEQAIEAQAFAYFGFLALRGRSIGGAWTGAEGFAPGGRITPGKNWKEVLEKLSPLF